MTAILPNNEAGVSRALDLLSAENTRLVSIFGSTDDNHVRYVHYLIEVDGREYRMLSSPVTGPIPSATPIVPAAAWYERELHDQYGIECEGHPDPRPLLFHENWPENVHPMIDDASHVPWAEGQYHFLRVHGDGVCEVPVGPIHAGIIEPGHFRFSVVGDTVLHLELRHFYTHKGTEKLFENIPVTHGVRLAESISGDSSFAHATAFCHAIERAAEVEAPPRARALRTLCLELERLYNHIGDIGAIATDVGFMVANMHALRLKERVLRVNEHLTGNRLLRGMACLGGVRCDWDGEQIQALEKLAVELGPEFDSLVELVEDSSSTRDRLEDTGILKPEVARDLGVVGIAGRASGFDHDLRRDFPHAAYDWVKFRVPVYQEGDVEHRMQVRIDEVRESLSIIQQLVADLPAGAVRVEIGELPAGRTALGYVEGWRGEIYHWIRTAPGNRLARCKVKDPSLQNWPALSEAILGNIIPDFPVVNKSFNLSYSGTDR